MSSPIIDKRNKFMIPFEDSEFYVSYDSVKIGNHIAKSTFKGSLRQKPVTIKVIKIHDNKHLEKIISQFEHVA